MPQPNNSKIYFKSLSTIHTVLLIGILFYSVAVIFLVHNNGGPKDINQTKNVFYIVASIFTIVGIAASYFTFFLKIKTIKSAKNLSEKMLGYRKAIILNYALLGIPVFISLEAYYRSGDYIFLAIASIPFIVLFTNKPDVNKCIAQLELDFNESAILSDPEGTW